MNNYFIDTSALFKRYIPESGTGQLDEIFNQEGCLYISDITIIELVSNLKRKTEITKELSHQVYQKIKKEFFNDIAEGNIRTLSAQSENIIEAINILDRSYMTPLDSIQLCTALLQKAHDENLIFICSDKKLSTLAKKNGLKCMVL